MAYTTINDIFLDEYSYRVGDVVYTTTARSDIYEGYAEPYIVDIYYQNSTKEESEESLINKEINILRITLEDLRKFTKNILPKLKRKYRKSILKRFGTRMFE